MGYSGPDKAASGSNEYPTSSLSQMAMEIHSGFHGSAENLTGKEESDAVGEMIVLSIDNAMGTADRSFTGLAAQQANSPVWTGNVSQPAYQNVSSALILEPSVLNQNVDSGGCFRVQACEDFTSRGCLPLIAGNKSLGNHGLSLISNEMKSMSKPSGKSDKRSDAEMQRQLFVLLETALNHDSSHVTSGEHQEMESTLSNEDVKVISVSPLPEPTIDGRLANPKSAVSNDAFSNIVKPSGVSSIGALRAGTISLPITNLKSYGEFILPPGFPKDPASLFVTGILDGAPVFYYDLENTVKRWALIMKDRYLCGCQDCGFVRPVSAVEFLCHSGFDFKYAELLIYFKTQVSIEDVVEMLQRTPPAYFFETVFKLTGWAANEQNFWNWNSRNPMHASKQVADYRFEHPISVEKPGTPSSRQDNGVCLRDN